ncbi:MAG: Gfo/Idh/MocA family oxidoreductase [Bryobacteraceae bacterium]|nr:Gfo/Idh/MocA family oxidoreductase [Bryobacteraceae bacterium]
MNRRIFLAGLSAAPLLRPQGRTYRTALIGSGWWGMNIFRTALEAGRSKPVALCDVDESQLKKASDEVSKLSGEQPKGYKDYTEMLAKEKPEIVIVATPDHWHPLAMIAAVRAGAHVYVEKPIGHTILEGRAMVKAAREADRVVQVGTHRRVSPHNVSGIQFLKSRKVGRIGMVRAFVHSAGGRGQRVPDSDPPAGLDWNLWVGPAPMRPYNKTIHPRGFRQYLEFANGTIGDWGIHWFDQILMWTEEQAPKSVYSHGARRIKEDNTNAPDTQVATFEFDRFTCVWEHRTYGGNEAEKAPLGAYFYGTEGTFHMGWRDGWTFYPSKKGEPPVHEAPKLNQPDDQNIRELWANFIESIEAKKRPVSDIEIGHRSTNMSLLAMISMRLGRSVQWDGVKETFPSDPEAVKLLSRKYRAPWEYPKI